jgi:hypothetical protein
MSLAREPLKRILDAARMSVVSARSRAKSRMKTPQPCDCARGKWGIAAAPWMPESTPAQHAECVRHVARQSHTGVFESERA